MLRLSLSLAWLAFLAPLARADVRVVGPSPAPYNQIQAAVDAASDGDVVLVKTGTYAAVQVLDKEVAIVADAGASVNVNGGLRVRNVSATRSVLLAGLNSKGAHTANLQTRHGLFAQNCSGPVRVVGCQLTGVDLESAPGASGYCQEGQGAWVDTASDVAFVRCVLRGSGCCAPGGTGFVYGDGGHGCYAQASTLTLYDSEARGGQAALGYGYTMGCPPLPDPVNDAWGAAGEGFRAEGGFLFASNSAFLGVDGIASYCVVGSHCICASAGANALVHNAGPLGVQLLAVTLTPGIGGFNTVDSSCGGLGGLWCDYCCPGSGVSCSMPSGVPVLGSATTISGQARTLSAPHVAREGQTVTLTFGGAPGDQVLLISARSPARRWLPSASGVLLLQRHLSRTVAVGTIGAGGTLTTTFTVGELGPSSSARILHLQALMVDAGGASRLSSPAVVALLDAAF